VKGSSTRDIRFNILTPREDASAVDAAIRRVVARGWFILGPEVEAFEREFAAAVGAAHAVAVGNGTDAIALTLRALGIAAGDEVITSPLSAAFSALAIMMAGARPVFADVDAARLTIDPGAIEAAITPRTRAILPVHLYGQPADMGRILEIAARRHLAVVEDACQAHLATCNGSPVGALGIAGAFSFYPTKNLGALGDGGAVVTNDPMIADRLRRLRNGGQSHRYVHVEFGVNSRLDEIQAAVLRARLPRLAGWTRARRALAARYRAALEGTPAQAPPECDSGHVYHLFPVLVQARDAFQRALEAAGIGTLVHYPLPIPRQQAFAHLPAASCPVADRVAASVCSLPLHPGLTPDDVERVATAARAWSPPARGA
jgi:dTDP-3-amino-3,4,6-trideoxy-alpha-D-glucose transaminase